VLLKQSGGQQDSHLKRLRRWKWSRENVLEQDWRAEKGEGGAKGVYRVSELITTHRHYHTTLDLPYQPYRLDETNPPTELP